jgi:cAMP-dependent protein kinase regulator
LTFEIEKKISLSNMRPSMNDNVSARNLVGKWEKAGTKDKLGATFKTEPVREKSAMMKKNEKAIGEYRKKFVSRNFKEKPKSRGMSMSKRPAQLKNVFGTELQDLTSYKPPVFPKSEEDISEIRKCISKNIFFNDITEKQQKTFIDAFEPVVVNKGDNLIEQGDVGDYFYVLTEGVVSFTIDGEDAGFASGGESFGDLAMIYSARRAASVAVQSDSNSSNLFRVDQKTFRSLMVKQTRIMEAEKEKLLNSVDFLNNISSIDMKRLAAVLTTRFAQPGETVIQKGSAGDTFFVISEGEVQVTDMSVGSIKFDDMKLSPGDYFGERAIAVDEPRAATVKATKKSILFSISKQAFEKVLGKHSRVIMKSQDKKILVRT